MTNPIHLLQDWWFFRQNGYPSKREVKRLLMNEHVHNYYNFDSSIYKKACVYSAMSDINVAADCLGVTRERLRQCLMKFRRTAYHAIKTKEIPYWVKKNI